MDNHVRSCNWKSSSSQTLPHLSKCGKDSSPRFRYLGSELSGPLVWVSKLDIFKALISEFRQVSDVKIASLEFD